MFLDLLVGVEGGFQAGFGDFEVCGPGDGVEDEGSEVGVFEVVVEVAAGCAEASGFGFGVLDGPCDDVAEWVFCFEGGDFE